MSCLSLWPDESDSAWRRGVAVGFALRGGADGANAALGPLSVDGLLLLAVELVAHRARLGSAPKANRS